MKSLLVLALLATTMSVKAQSLKETLFAGKLKSDTGSVVRKGEDLSTKIDTTTRKKPAPVVEPPAQVVTASLDASGNIVTTAIQQDGTPVAAGSSGSATPAVDSAGNPVPVKPKDNNELWKNYIDEFTTTLRTDLAGSKKVKDGTYSILIDYEIGVDGQIGVNNVNVAPENSFIAQQVKERITLTAPRMQPLLGTNGKPRKAAKKQTITISK
ncbi:hypothetical protein LZZ85_21130 [Terrimonas sp. NA20]|uniref:TonB C-terminal domain-containing protein n=1 Tax=Terrimonas ginsenosidimutans TaxID=2908004 RepID=A0ABS9KWX1_9BACT|nr:hypothetical protein [Terrimonas ginsenosidimutans]MCG2616816.1 hypothetical protein [Terrimonas ginsenosidimutans]